MRLHKWRRLFLFFSFLNSNTYSLRIYTYVYVLNDPEMKFKQLPYLVISFYFLWLFQQILKFLAGEFVSFFFCLYFNRQSFKRAWIYIHAQMLKWMISLKIPSHILNLPSFDKITNKQSPKLCDARVWKINSNFVQMCTINDLWAMVFNHKEKTPPICV